MIPISVNHEKNCVPMYYDKYDSSAPNYKVKQNNLFCLSDEKDE